MSVRLRAYSWPVAAAGLRLQTTNLHRMLMPHPTSWASGRSSCASWPASCIAHAHRVVQHAKCSLARAWQACIA